MTIWKFVECRCCLRHRVCCIRKKEGKSHRKRKENSKSYTTTLLNKGEKLKYSYCVGLMNWITRREMKGTMTSRTTDMLMRKDLEKHEKSIFHLEKQCCVVYAFSTCFSFYYYFFLSFFISIHFSSVFQLLLKVCI